MKKLTKCINPNFKAPKQAAWVFTVFSFRQSFPINVSFLFDRLYALKPKNPV